MCEVNGSILGPGLIQHRSFQPIFQSVSHIFAYLVGPNKKNYVCLGLPLKKKLGRVGRDFF